MTLLQAQKSSLTVDHEDGDSSVVLLLTVLWESLLTNTLIDGCTESSGHFIFLQNPDNSM